LHPFAEKLRAEADSFRCQTFVDAAAMLISIADDLDRFEDERKLEALTLRDAADATGYSPAHLSRLIAEGKLSNVGRGRAPMVRRGDLPRKRPLQADGPDLSTLIGARVDSQANEKR
jgi:hypothetical protein